MTGFSLSQQNISHWFHFVLVVFLLIIMLVEARRYRYYVVSQNRVRLLEMGFYADVILSGCVRSSEGFNKAPPTPQSVALANARRISNAAVQNAGFGFGGGFAFPSSSGGSSSSKESAPLRGGVDPMEMEDSSVDDNGLTYGPGGNSRLGGMRRRQNSSPYIFGTKMSLQSLTGLLDDPPKQKGTWEQQLASSLRRPASPISLFHSIVIRLRRMYIYLIGGCLCGWLVKLSVGDAYGDTLTVALLVPVFVIYAVVALALPFVFRESEEDV